MQMLISVTEEVKTEPGEYSITPLINFSNLIELTFLFSYYMQCSRIFSQVTSSREFHLY